MMSDSNMFVLRDVPVSFPHFFTRPIINGKEGKCSGVLMLNNKAHAKDIAAIRNRIKEMVQESFKGQKLPSDRVCLRDGEDKGRPEYEGCHTLSASTRDGEAVLIVGSDGEEIAMDEKHSPFYAGCHINAKIRLWPMNNEYGKRINAELVAVQFAKHGKPLDGITLTTEQILEGFDALPDAMVEGDELVDADDAW